MLLTYYQITDILLTLEVPYLKLLGFREQLADRVSFIYCSVVLRT